MLAVCDVDEAKKQLQECKDALAHENETYEISAQISDTQIKIMGRVRQQGRRTTY